MMGCHLIPYKYKLASLEAMLVQNFDQPTESATHRAEVQSYQRSLKYDKTHDGGAGDVDDNIDDGFDTCHSSVQGPGAH